MQLGEVRPRGDAFATCETLYKLGLATTEQSTMHDHGAVAETGDLNQSPWQIL